MKISLSDIEKEGFSVLHGKWGNSKIHQSIVGLDGNRVHECRDYNPGIRIGYFAYPNPSLKNIIPSSLFYAYDKLQIINPSCRRASACAPSVGGIGFKTSGRLEQSVSKSEYIKKIKRIKELLAAGEVYQINFAIRFRKKFSGNPYALFLKLTEVNPVDFAAYLNCGDFQIVSSSPECLFRVKNGKITTTPIKGTMSKKNEKNLEKLISSEKERAELDMITDLERNDVGKICEYGTLKLKKEREILELKNLWHCYSEVEGKLRLDVGPNEVIEAMFPGGSITGCPKKRAMEYISLLEGLPRNIYTGSIGYFQLGAGSYELGAESKLKAPSSELQADFNIAIRTVLIKDGWMEFWAGGGIVADSDPEKEYEEALLKAEKFLGLI